MNEFKKFIGVEDTPTMHHSTQRYFEDDVEKNNYYYNMVDFETGKRYDIPMLSKGDAGYYYKYITYMKVREQSLETFNKIMDWG